MNAVDVLKYGQQTALNTLKAFPEAEWNRPGACGIWSVKDIIAHLASYEHMLVEVLGGFLEGGPTPTLEKMGAGLEQFNAEEVSARRDQSMAEVLAEFNEVHAQTMTLAARIPADTYRQNGTLPWYGSEYDLDDFIVYTFYGHKREHSAQIAAFSDSLAR
ncbi:MAG: hypothetical protein DPW09_07300 [Anaerolineae bacterium]|nr:DinB family protein [Anaerolineales bacterium]MCQ3973235.1 hypothetical protein [Anaerolineae bacterium]